MFCYYLCYFYFVLMFRLEKHQDSRENKTNRFPLDHMFSVYCKTQLQD